MASLKQAEAIMRIYQRLVKTITYDEAAEWDKQKASDFIGKHYWSYYEELRKRLFDKTASIDQYLCAQKRNSQLNGKSQNNHHD